MIPLQTVKNSGSVLSVSWLYEGTSWQPGPRFIFDCPDQTKACPWPVGDTLVRHCVFKFVSSVNGFSL